MIRENPLTASGAAESWDCKMYQAFCFVLLILKFEIAKSQ
jgi:hypothetical protein